MDSIRGDLGIRRSYETCHSHDGGFAPSYAIYGSTASTTGSNEAMVQAQSWLHDCLCFHKGCKAGIVDPDWHPTRLIDLGPTLNSTPKIVDREEIIANSPYATLSYCWGSSPPQTTSHSLQKLRQSIPEDKLPKTFRDAFDVARSLQIRYIWIDSLCIVQDSLEDWRQESMTMGQVYQTAICNFAAIASSDGNGGMFRHRYTASLRPPTVELVWAGDHRLLKMCKPNIWIDEIFASPLMSRAWVI